MGTIHVLIPIAVFVFLIAVTWISAREKRAKAEAQRDVQLALLAKFSSGEDMSKFLATEEGRRLVDQLSEPGEGDPRKTTIGLLTGGLIVLPIGLAFFLLSISIRGLIIPGSVITAAGVGVLIAAWVTHRVSKKLGLTRPRADGLSDWGKA